MRVITTQMKDGEGSRQSVLDAQPSLFSKRASIQREWHDGGQYELRDVALRPRIISELVFKLNREALTYR